MCVSGTTFYLRENCGGPNRFATIAMSPTTLSSCIDSSFLPTTPFVAH